MLENIDIPRITRFQNLVILVIFKTKYTIMDPDYCSVCASDFNRVNHTKCCKSMVCDACVDVLFSKYTLTTELQECITCEVDTHNKISDELVKRIKDRTPKCPMCDVPIKPDMFYFKGLHWVSESESDSD